MTTEASKRVAKYTRISSDPSGLRFGVGTQSEEIDQRLAREANWVLAGEYEDDDTSAYKENAKRPGFDQMMADAEAGRLDIIVARHMDRLTRRDDSWAVIKKRCMNAGVTVITTADGVDTSTDAGRLLAGLLANVAEFEMERKKYRTLSANLRRAEMGGKKDADDNPRGKGWGPKAFGYNGDHNDPKLVPKEAAAVLKAYRDVMAGSSVYSVFVQWRAAGFVTNKGNPWDRVAIKRLLLNPRYMGKRMYNGEIIGDGDWPAIVDEDTFLAVKHIIEGQAQGGGRSARKYLLGGLMTCSECGGPVLGGKANNARQASTVEDRPNYRCKTYLCGAVYRRQRMVDPWIQNTVLNRIREIGWRLVSEVDPEQVEALHNEATALRVKIDSLGVAFATGDMTAGQVKSATDNLQARLKVVESSIARLAKSEVFDGLIGAEDMHAVWEGFDLERKRAVIRALCDQIVMYPIGKKGRSASALPFGYNMKIHWRKPLADN